MSHFSVVVIGENYEEQLAPYHEFECTGRADEYVQSVDITDEVRSEYEKGTRRMVILPSGEAISAYDNRFYREPTAEERALLGPFAGTGYGKGMSWTSQDWGDGKGYQTRVLDLSLAPGAEEKDLPYPEVMSFREFCDYWVEKPIVKPGEEPDYSEDGNHKWGWIEVDDAGEVVKVIRRTNPNSRWDWYEVGGRWAGYFPLRDGAVGDQGFPGLMTPAPKARTADQCAWGDVDLERARNEAVDDASVRFDLWEQAFRKHEAETGSLPISFAEALEKCTGDDGETDYDAARTLFHEQGAIADYDERLRARSQHRLSCPVAEFGFDKEAYLESKRRKALVPFAVVKDGVWYEKGKMGWWATVFDEKDENVWVEQVAALFEGLDPETTVTMVDCHI